MKTSSPPPQKGQNITTPKCCNWSIERKGAPPPLDVFDFFPLLKQDGQYFASLFTVNRSHLWRKTAIKLHERSYSIFAQVGNQLALPRTKEFRVPNSFPTPSWHLADSFQTPILWPLFTVCLTPLIYLFFCFQWRETIKVGVGGWIQTRNNTKDCGS